MAVTKSWICIIYEITAKVCWCYFWTQLENKLAGFS